MGLKAFPFHSPSEKKARIAIKMKFLLLFIFLALFPFKKTYAQRDHSKNSLQIITESLESGRIDDEEATNLKIKILRGETLPENFRSDRPIKCGFGMAAESKEYLKNRPEKKITLGKQTMQSQYLHNFSAMGGQRTFRINYDVTGPDAVPSLDANTNGIPDWVDETALAFERSYRLEVDTMGYREPLSFSLLGQYDIYILDLNNLYGYTETVSQVTSNPDTYTSAIYIENDYSEGFYTHGYDALRVTCGHEFFHAIQFSYHFRLSDAWYYELSSTWMEDVTYDDVNDYYAYLPGYFNNPSISLDETDGYSAAHWNHMMEKKYGRNMIKKSWELMPTRNALAAIDDAIKDNSSSNLARNISELALWDYYTAGRSDSINYFSESPYYPPVKLLSKRTILDTLIQRSLPRLGANYYSFYATDTTHCEIRFNAVQSNSFFDVYTVLYNKAADKNFFIYHDGASIIPINNLLPEDTLVCIVVNKVKDKIASNNYAYTLSLAVKQGEVIPPSISNFLFYPSPFVLKSGTEKMKFKFILGETSKIEFSVYSIAGKLLRRIKFGEIEEGPYDGNNGLYWDGKDADGHIVPSGVYIYQFIGNNFKKTGKIAVVR